jgi:hypothetical protein
MLTQTDPRWGFETMALPQDRIRDYGCLITALVNLNNLIYGKEMTVSEANRIIKSERFYSGLRNPKLDPYYHSFLMTDDFLAFLKLKKKEVRDMMEDCWYYCRVEVMRPNGTTIGNFTNVFQINDRVMLFDVWDGSFRHVSRSIITNIYQVEVL